MPLSPEDESIRVQIWNAVRSIPPGQVDSYGGVGSRVEPKISGYICGRYLGYGTEGLPWWRVVAKDGSLSIARRNPDLAREQRQRLEAEGVTFGEDGTVSKEFFLDRTPPKSDT